MPVIIQFDGLVSKDKQDDIEKRVSVTTTPAVKGAWGWLDARQLIWRPATYWTPGTKVSVKADLAGIKTRTGIWTTRNASNTFTIGSSMISTVDIKAHTDDGAPQRHACCGRSRSPPASRASRPAAGSR